MDFNISNKYYKIDNYHDNKPYYFYILPNCLISNYVINNKIWEPYMHHIFNIFINKESIVVECGCHIGTHTLKIASLCNKLYAYEPMPDTNKVLNANIKLNNIDNVVIFEEGVSDSIGQTKFNFIPDGNPGGSCLDNNPMGDLPYMLPTTRVINVKLTTIDLLNLDKLDFMKIDVEGYEPLVINGAMNTIKKCKPVIIMEVWKNHYGQFDLDYTKTLFKELLNVGYNIIHIDGPNYLFTPF